MGIFANIFSWDARDDFGIKLFYDCELLIDVGHYDKGDKFTSIQFDDEKMVLYFFIGDYNDDENPSVQVMFKELGIIV